MENKNMTAAREWENDPNCFLRMLNSPAQQRSRAARRQKDADRAQELAALHMRNAYDNMIKNGLLDAYDEKERIDG